MNHWLRFASLALASPLAFGQTSGVVRDLDAKEKVLLSKDELTQLLPGASVRRVNSQGSGQAWKNDAGGSFIASSDNRGEQGHPSTARGQWRISDDGRYCVQIDWKRHATEDWCHVILKAGDSYYSTKSASNPDGRLYLLEISK